MLTVVMLSWEYPPHVVGGLARHVHGLSRELAALGHAVHVITGNAPGLPAEEKVDGVHVIRVAPYFQEPPDFRLWVCHLNFAMMESGVNLLKELHGPVVLHAHDWLVSHAAKGLKNLFQLPLIATIHATEYGRHGGIYNPGQQYINDIEWWLTYEARRVIVCSQAMRMEVRTLFGLGPDKVTVIPNGVDLPTRDGRGFAAERLRFAAPGERLLFHVGRLVPEKGAGVLLEALPLLLKDHAVRLVIGGVGPYGEELRRKADQLGLADRIHLIGWLDDEAVRKISAMADVAVVPSLYEPFGIVALEAMAAGVPLVASDIGGLAEIVRHGKNGLKAPPGDPSALAHRLSQVLTDRALATRLANSALTEVRVRYAWPGIARKTGSIYESVLGSRQNTEWNPACHDQAAPPHFRSQPGRYTI